MPNHIHRIFSDRDYENKILHSTLSEFRKFTGNLLSKMTDNYFVVSWSQIIRKTAESDHARRLWQSGWHAKTVATKELFEQKLYFFHQNPMRAGIVGLLEHWTHSSSCYWLFGEVFPVFVSSLYV